MAAEETSLPAEFLEELRKYNYVRFVVPDIMGIARGKVVFQKFLEKYAKEGMDVFAALCAESHIRGLFVQAVKDFTGHHLPNCRIRPCLDTLVPWPWVGNQSRRTGNILCDVIPRDGFPEFLSPRQLLKAQFEALRDRHGLVIKTAFEYEFVVLDDTTQKPLADDNARYMNVGIWDRYDALFAELHEVLESMGVDISSWLPENHQGQFELTTDPVEGVRGADVAFYVKNAIKGFFRTRGYNATFLSRVWHGQGTSLHMNHSLWKAGEILIPGGSVGPCCDQGSGGSRGPCCEAAWPTGASKAQEDKDGVGERKREGEGRESVMSDSQDPHNMSLTAKHWLAGLIHHAPALCAFLCPTPNCYRVLHRSLTPSDASWGVDDRTKMIRVRHIGQNNTFFEHRAPTGAANPYLVIAAIVAAGMDGLERKLECPPPSEKERTDQCQELPRTLPEALKALEEDRLLKERLGERFVGCYVALKRGCDVKPLEDAGLKTEEEILEFEKKMYLNIF